MHITQLDHQPNGINVIYLNAVLMDNGEIICAGKTVGFFNDLQKFVYIPTADLE